MDKTERSVELSRDLLLYAKGEISDSKRADIESLLSEDTELNKLYNDFFSQEKIETAINNHSKIDITDKWDIQLNKIDKYRRLKLSVFKLMKLSVAAVIVVMVGYFYSKYNKEPKPVVATITPGSSKAKLVLSDGSEKILNETKNVQLKEDSTIIRNTGNQIIYKNSGNKAKKEIKYHKLVIPRGGEYKLLLSDGTTVWLNSQTTLTYPVEFAEDKRTVKLKGEAFFDVAKNSKVPFIVKSGDNEIEVIGTKFNVRSYEDEKVFSTTLNEGRVRITDNKSAVLLFPNQQVMKSASESKYSIRKVDASIHSAWVLGKYIFKNESLKVLFERLSRWYDYEVEFKSESVKSMKFYGTINKNEGIEKFLKLLNKTRRINYKIKDKKITISNYSK